MVNEIRDSLAETIVDGDRLNRNNPYVIYSNHDELLKQIGQMRSVPYFYSAFGKNNIGLFEQLERPPSDAFGFGYFICSLLESSLLDVLVLDERYASSLMHNNEINQDLLRKNTLARIYPCFSITKVESTKDAESNKTKHQFSLIDATRRKSQMAPDEEFAEGITFASESSPIISYEDEIEISPDIVAMHDGVFEMALRSEIVDQNDVKSLNEICTLVRTSGRGLQKEIYTEFDFT